MESSEELILGQNTNSQRKRANFSSSSESGHRWTEDEITLLVDVRYFLNRHFDKGQLNALKIWTCILQNMKMEADSLKNLSLIECLTKWEELVREYYKLQKDNDISLDRKMKWKYFSQLHEILKDRPIPSVSSDNSYSDKSTESLKITDSKSLELKKYKLELAQFAWKQRKWKEQKVFLKQQRELLQNLNSGLNDLAGVLKTS